MPGFFDVIFGSNEPKSKPKKIKKVKKPQNTHNKRNSIKNQIRLLTEQLEGQEPEPETDESEPEIETDDSDA